MPRYPNFSVGGLLRAGDYFGTFVFACTGTLASASVGMDLMGCVVVGCVTALGGGTVRDILLGKGRRAFWMDEPEYMWIALISATLTFFFWDDISEELGLKADGEVMQWFDAVSLGAFCVIGAQNGLRAGVPLLACAICGMMTGTFGGVIRDIVSHRPVRIFHSHAEIYAPTVFSGAVAYLVARAMALPVAARIGAGWVTCLIMRKWAWTHDVKLPDFARGTSWLFPSFRRRVKEAAE